MSEQFIKRGPTDCWNWIGPADEAPNRNMKMACVNPNCCNPRHVVGDNEIVIPDDEPEESSTTTVNSMDAMNSLDDLRAKAESLGMTIDGRWGPERLQEEIDKFLKE